MISSKEVFRLKKEGYLDDAYDMACKLMANNPEDKWNIRAYGWCLYDKIKLEAQNGDFVKAQDYYKKLKSVWEDESDDFMEKALKHSEYIIDPSSTIISQIKEKSKNNEHEVSLALCRKGIKIYPDSLRLHDQYAWELWRKAKSMISCPDFDIQSFKLILNEYLHLKNERPSRLHNLILGMALKVYKKGDFNLYAFVKIWDLNNLSDEGDYINNESYDIFGDVNPSFDNNTNNEKAHSSLVEQVIQNVSKDICKSESKEGAEYILPFINSALSKNKDSIWLLFYKAKVLHLLGEDEEAIDVFMPVIKSKGSNFWVWSNLATFVSDDKDVISCYCKALLCERNLKFVLKVKIILAEFMVKNGYFAEAKTEIMEVIRFRESEGSRIPDKISAYQEENWYKESHEKKNNQSFYEKNKALAESLAFRSFPWLEACIGTVFSQANKPERLSRKVFIKTEKGVISTVMSNKVFGNLEEGISFKVKGEYGEGGKFNVYLIEKRQSDSCWDIFDWCEGNIIKINSENSRCRVSDVQNEITVDFKDMAGIEIIEGLPVYIKYHSRKVTKDREFYIRNDMLAIKVRSEGSEWDSFFEYVGVVDHVNETKGVLHYVVSTEIDGIIKLERLESIPSVGDRVAVRVINNNGFLDTLTCRITEDSPTNPILSEFEGIVEVMGNFGFVNNVFIEGLLIKKYDIKDRNIVSGVSLLNYNRRRDEWGYKAIDIKEVLHREEGEECDY